MTPTRLIGYLRSMVRDKNERKGIFRIIKEVIHLTLIKRELPLHYFSSRLYLRDRQNYTDFLSINDFLRLKNSRTYHKLEYGTLLRNKLSFAFFCDRFEIPAPDMLGFNSGNNFFHDQKYYTIQTKTDLSSFFERLLAKTDDNILFIKQVVESSGKGCYRLVKKELSDFDEKNYVPFTPCVCVHQRRLEQYPQINQLYPHSINTIRFDSYMDNDDQVHILSAVMRTSSGGNFLDNIGSGECSSRST